MTGCKSAARRGPGAVRDVMAAVLLLAAGAAIGWLSFRSAMVRTVPPSASVIAQIAPHDPQVVLARATDLLVRRHGLLDAATLDAVRRAAIAAPLDARPFLTLGHQQLLEGAPDEAVATLEAGERRDPRQRLIHLLLLDRYLRAGRYGDAAMQFSVLARLLGAAQAPIAAAMAQMAMAPETRDAVRRTLWSDPILERAVLKALAAADTAPAAIFALASPAAALEGRIVESWGPVLIARLVRRGRYAAARSAWQHIYAVPPAQAAALVTDAGFGTGRTAPPFDWTLVAGSLGAADSRGGSLAVEYYGRDTGVLASQLLVLPPGPYRFSVNVDPGTTAATAKLFWALACGAGTFDPDKPALMNVAVIAAARPRRIAADIVVPDGCPVQMLTLRGEAGAFPVPLSVTLRDLDLRAASPAASPATAPAAS